MIHFYGVLPVRLKGRHICYGVAHSGRLDCKRHIETTASTGHKHFDKLGANNKSLMEFCAHSAKTSAETRQGNQMNAELMLGLFMAQVNPNKRTII